MMPPLITVGSRSPASSRAATIEVVVVLPWVPAMATQLFSRISSASISARRTTGNALGARRHQFGIVALDRGRHHQHIGAVDVLGLVADADRDALVAQPGDIGALGGIGALHGVAEIAQAPRRCRSCRCRRSRRSGWVRSRAAVSWLHPYVLVMPGISANASRRLASRASANPAHFMQDVDGRDKPGHDAKFSKSRRIWPKFRRLSSPDRPAARRHPAGRRCGRRWPSRSAAPARRRARRFPPPAGRA